MSKHKKIISNSLWLSLQPISLNIVSLIVVGYVARTLGQDGYGKFNYAFAFVAMFMPFVNLGLGTLTTRHIAENIDQSDIYLGRIICLRLLLIAVTMVIYYVVVALFNVPSDTKIALCLVGLTILFNGLIVTLNSAFQGIEEMRYISIVQFITGIVIICSSVAVLHFGYRLTGLIQVYVIGNMVSFILSTYFANKYFKVMQINASMSFIITTVKKSFHFFIPSLLSVFSSKGGILLIGHFAGTSAVGLYTAASGLIDRLLVVPDSLSTAIFPSLAASWKNTKEETGKIFRRYYKSLMLIGLPMAIGITVTSDSIISIIFGTQFMQSGLVLKFLAWWMLFSYFCQYFSYTLSAIHFEKSVAKLSFIFTLLYLTLCILLIPVHGIIGSAVAAVVARGIQALALYMKLSRCLGISFLFDKTTMKICLASLIMGIGVYTLRHELLVSILFGSVIYVLLIFMLGLFSIRDIKKVLATLQNPSTDLI